LIYYRHEASAPLKAIAVAGLAALLIGTESPAFAAAPKVASGQGELLDQLLAQQKAGSTKAKTIKAAVKPAEVAVYGKNKPNSAPKPAAKKAAPKPAAKKAVVQQKVATKALKFDTKAGTGTQGAAPAGLELPVPKGAVKVAAKPAAAAKKAPAPKAAAKPAAAKAAPKVAAAAKPVAAKAAPASKAAAPAPKVSVQKAATAAAATATAAKVATSSAPAFKAAASSAPAAAGAYDGAIQAGAVIVAELAGLAIASSVVGQIIKPAKASKA
jgi:hypothetical protein